MVVGVVVADRDHHIQATHLVTILTVVVTFGPVGLIGVVVAAAAAAAILAVVAQLRNHQLLVTEMVALHPVILVLLNMVKIMQQTFTISILNGNTHRFRIHIKTIFSHKQQVSEHLEKQFAHTVIFFDKSLECRSLVF